MEKKEYKLELVGDLDVISLVEDPAIKVEFYKFREENEGDSVKFNFLDEEQRIVVGPALIPDFKIYRKNLDGFVSFDKEQIVDLSSKYIYSKKLYNVEHGEKFSSDNQILESWIIENEQDKANTKFGYDLPDGTWMIKMKINNDEVWDKIKVGKINGFSIEAQFKVKEDMKFNNELETVEDIDKAESFSIYFDKEYKLDLIWINYKLEELYLYNKKNNNYIIFKVDNLDIWNPDSINNKIGNYIKIIDSGNIELFRKLYEEFINA